MRLPADFTSPYSRIFFASSAVGSLRFLVSRRRLLSRYVLLSARRFRARLSCREAADVTWNCAADQFLDLLAQPAALLGALGLPSMASASTVSLFTRIERRSFARRRSVMYSRRVIAAPGGGGLQRS